VTRRKLDKYFYCQEAENVIERGKPLYTRIKGNWNEIFFKNPNPIILELACGKGDYTIGLAQRYPDRNFIGIDIKGDRISQGSKIASDLGLINVAFLRASIQYLDEFFEEDEVNEIWLVHPDPHVRDRDEKKRLTNPSFLADYKKYLRVGGILHLKTDSPDLYQYSLNVFEQVPFLRIIDHTSDLYKSPLYAYHHNIVTHYERVFYARGFSIKYIQAVNKKGTS
jgi:tRNA (guanine-N7-)-methyltransferase